MLKKPDRTTVSWPSELTPLIQERMKEEHYGTIAKYFLGLLLFDLFSRCKHWLTSQVVNEPAAILEKVVLEIVRDFYKKDRRDGGWFRARVQEIIDEHHGKPLSE